MRLQVGRCAICKRPVYITKTRDPHRFIDRDGKTQYIGTECEKRTVDNPPSTEKERT